MEVRERFLLLDALAAASNTYRTCQVFAISKDNRERWSSLAAETEALHAKLDRELTAETAPAELIAVES